MYNLYFKEMTDLEQYIAKMINAKKELFIRMSISEFGEEINVSNSMISKYARNCGFEGYKELRYYIKNLILSPTNGKDNIVERKVLSYLYNYNQKEMVQLQKYCTSCDKIVLCGDENTKPISQYISTGLAAAFSKEVTICNDCENLPKLEDKSDRITVIYLTKSGNNFTDFAKNHSRVNCEDNIIVIAVYNNHQITNRCNLFINLLYLGTQNEIIETGDGSLFMVYLETLIRIKDKSAA